jgi:radical SAM superfamily enzyme YgiQ (UPF0313 family)
MQLRQIDFINPRHGEGFSKYGLYCQPYGGQVIRQIVRMVDPSIQFRIIDETRGDNIDYEGDVMFGTAYTYPVKRLYQIARAYREREKVVILGGIHISSISSYPELHSKEYQNADAIVIGEGESVIPEIVADLKAERLKPMYFGHPVEVNFPVLCEEPLRWGWGVSDTVYSWMSLVLRVLQCSYHVWSKIPTTSTIFNTTRNRTLSPCSTPHQLPNVN